MVKNAKPQLQELERAALAELWAQVVLDPNAHPVDVDAARHKLSTPELKTADLERVDAWKLAAIQSLLQDDEYTAQIKALYMRDQTPTP